MKTLLLNIGFYTSFFLTEIFLWCGDALEVLSSFTQEFEDFFEEKIKRRSENE